MNNKNFIFFTILTCLSLACKSHANTSGNNVSSAPKENEQKSTTGKSQSPFAGIAAKATDKFMIKGNQSPLLKPLTFVGARATSLVLFPIGTTADLLYNTTKGNTEGIQKSALGLIASP